MRLSARCSIALGVLCVEQYNKYLSSSAYGTEQAARHGVSIDALGRVGSGPSGTAGMTCISCPSRNKHAKRPELVSGSTWRTTFFLQLSAFDKHTIRDEVGLYSLTRPKELEQPLG